MVLSLIEDRYVEKEIRKTIFEKWKTLSVLFSSISIRGLCNYSFRMWTDIKAFSSGRWGVLHTLSYFSQRYCILTIWISLNSGSSNNNFNTVSDSYYIGSNGRTNDKLINWKLYGKKWLLPDLRYCPFIHLNG
jgi:hypothetical protein